MPEQTTFVPVTEQDVERAASVMVEAGKDLDEARTDASQANAAKKAAQEEFNTRFTRWQELRRQLRTQQRGAAAEEILRRHGQPDAEDGEVLRESAIVPAGER